MNSLKRKLTAILSADVVGYSRLMRDDEETTVHTLKSYRKVIESLVNDHRGRLVDSPGDNILAEFSSVVDALRCAWDIQQEIKSRNLDLPENRRMAFRIGVNLGDVIEEDGRIYGDGVNVAARLEGLADAGGISISSAAYNHVKNKLPFRYGNQGKQTVKNIDEPVHVYRVVMESELEASSRKSVKKEMKSNLKRNFAVAFIVLILLLGGAAIYVWNTYFHIPDVENITEQKDEIKPQKRTCIAVLPFDNMSGDPEQEYFSDGLTEEIITTLSGSKQFLVVARNSTFSYKGKSVNVQEVGRELGATHIVEGSVRKEGNKIRVTAQLINAATGNHLWAETYDRELNDILILQNEISEKIAGSLILGYQESEIDRVRRIPTDNLTALDLLWRGLPYQYKLTKESIPKARDYYKRAIKADPRFSTAYALVAATEVADYSLGFSPDPEKSLDKAFDMAQKAIAINENTALGHQVLGLIYSFKNQYEQAIAAIKKAISLDPNHSDAYGDMADILMNVGRPAEAVEAIEKAILLNPHHPNIYQFKLGRAYQMLGRYKEAIKSLQNALILNPNFIPTYWSLSGNYLCMWITQNRDPQILDRAFKRAEQALNLADSSVISHYFLSLVYLYRKQYEQALVHGEKAFTIAPNLPYMKALKAGLLLYTEKTEETLELLEKVNLNIPHESAGFLLM